MKHALRVLVVATALSLLPLAANAAPGDCRLENPADPTSLSLCRSDVWFHQAAQKASNVAAADGSAFPGWNTTAPSASVTSGAGAGFLGTWWLDYVDESDPTTAATFDGTFSGAIDNVAVTMYLAAPDAAIDGYHYFRAQLFVDGARVYASDFVNGIDVPATPNPNGDLTYEIKFALTGLAKRIANDTADHSVRLMLTPLFVGSEGVYVYDTVEVPAGMIFNLEPDNLDDYAQISA